MMRRCLTTGLMVAVLTTVVRADVTIRQTTSVEGGAAAMTGVAATPTTTTRIKGQKQRTDIEVAGQSFSTIVDLTTKQIAILHPDQKTVQIIAGGAEVRPQIELPDGNGALQATGHSQIIDGVPCDEYSFETEIELGAVGSGQMQVPPQAAAMMQGATMTMKGSVWVAKSIPGADEYASFIGAASRANLTSLVSGGASGSNGAMGRLLSALAKLKGIAYMSDMMMSVGGTGQFADMMKQVGETHVTSKVSSISTDPIDDAVFAIPADYTVIKP